MADNFKFFEQFYRENVIPLYSVSQPEVSRSGPPLSPRTRIAVTEASLPKAIDGSSLQVPHPFRDAPSRLDYDSVNELCRKGVFYFAENRGDIIVAACRKDERIFHERGISRSPHFTYVYMYLFEDIKFKLPFSLFTCQVLSVANAAPSQLHPNSWAYIRCFEIIVEYFHIQLPARLFFFFYE